MSLKIFEAFAIPFITGGLIVSGVKYTASVLTDTRLSAIIGGFPIGLFSIYFLNDKEAVSYGYNYLIMTGVLFLSVVIFNVLYKYVKLSKNVSHIISILAWFVFAAVRFYV